MRPTTRLSCALAAAAALAVCVDRVSSASESTCEFCGAPENVPNAAPAGASSPTHSEKPPAPESQTKPTGIAIQGSLSIGGGIDLQKPDLTRAVVYLASQPALDAAPSGIDHATMAQRNKAFVPNFVVVPKGTSVEFPNWDDFDHNVFSRSAAAPAFDLDRYPKGQSKSRVFEKTGVVQVFCNIHPSMRGIVFVTPNRYFARVNADGTFVLPAVPPGTYEIVAWHDRCAESRQTIEVRTDGAPPITIALSQDRTAILENKPARRESYGVENGLGIKREKLNLPVVSDSHASPDPPPSR